MKLYNIVLLSLLTVLNKINPQQNCAKTFKIRIGIWFPLKMLRKQYNPEVDFFPKSSNYKI